MKLKSALFLFIVTTVMALVACSQKTPSPGSASITLPAKYDVNQQQSATGSQSYKARTHRKSVTTRSMSNHYIQ